MEIKEILIVITFIQNGLYGFVGQIMCGRCSNHNESFHKVINSSLYNKRTFKSKLANLIQQTLKHCSNMKQRRASSIKRKVKNIVIFIINKTKNNNFDIFSLCDTNGNCSEAIYNEQIYDI